MTGKERILCAMEHKKGDRLPVFDVVNNPALYAEHLGVTVSEYKGGLAAKLAKKNGCFVILNPAPVKEVPEELYGYVDLLIPNEFEASLITGVEVTDRESAAVAIAKLMEKGCKNALVTLGKQGCAYRSGERVQYEDIIPIKVVDTTAAGDSFIGGLCTKLCEGAEISEAVKYATAVSTLTVSRAGASVSIPTCDEVKAFLETL
jgi:ribokinase